MPSALPRSHPRKTKGEWAEIQFLSRAHALGLIVSKPWGDSARYDFIVEGKNGVRRVQVKSGWVRKVGRRRYRVNVAHGYGPGRCYSRQEVDLIAAYVVPEDVWYFIPITVLRSRPHIWLCPDKPGAKTPFERYREAWHLLV